MLSAPHKALSTEDECSTFIDLLRASDAVYVLLVPTRVREMQGCCNPQRVAGGVADDEAVRTNAVSDDWTNVEVVGRQRCAFWTKVKRCFECVAHRVTGSYSGAHSPDG